MKTNRNLYLFAAALVAGTMGMTSCSNEEITPDNVNPTYNGESVKTQFAINIPYGKSGTRMSEDNTQGDGATAAFLGMHNIYLVPLTGEGTGSSTFTSVIPLDGFTAFETGSSNYKLYNDVNIPVGTTNFLFYGVGGGSVPENATGKFQNGILTSTLPTTPNAAAVSFNLEQILTGNEFETPQTDLLKLLNDVAGVTNWASQSEDTELGALYKNYITLVGGSANSIRLTMEELYNAVSEITGDATVTQIVTNIKTRIAESFTVTDNTGTDGKYVLTWKNTNTYPTNLNVPEGAAQVDFDNGTKKFSYVTAPTVGNSNELDVYNLCYPASLAYFINTPLKATTLTTVTWPSTAADWTSESWTGWGEAVTATTRTVALKENIRYGVANLKTTVKCKNATLEDNAAEITGAQNNQNIVVPNNGFQVTGILVGGQPSVVGWNMIPVGTTEYNQTVYDNSLTDIYAKNNVASSPNYTLVLDNSMNSTKPVSIALELVNNSGTDFYGVQGKIAAGAKFYLVAQLDPTAVNPTPSVESVFLKNYQTEANLTITSLKNAYVTIPDLRASELVLGLSVDLKWETGIKFDVEIK